MKKVFVVTGASKGIGLQTVISALKEGYQVVGTSRNSKKLANEVQKLLPEKEKCFLAIEMPFTEAGIKSAIKTVIERFGHIDVLVNNAGYALLGAIEELAIKDIKDNFDVNFFGALNVIQTVLPYMRKQNSGRIINISSISGTVTGPTQGIYSASKAALIMLSEALSDEVKQFNIQVTAVCPWGVRTDFLDKSSMKQSNNEINDYTAVRKTMQGFNHLNHNQSGDPVLVGNAIVKLGKMEQMPKRIYLGEGALGALQYKIDEIIRETNENIDFSQSIDFDN